MFSWLKIFSPAQLKFQQKLLWFTMYVTEFVYFRFMCCYLLAKCFLSPAKWKHMSLGRQSLVMLSVVNRHRKTTVRRTSHVFDCGSKPEYMEKTHEWNSTRRGRQPGSLVRPRDARCATGANPTELMAVLILLLQLKYLRFTVSA